MAPSFLILRQFNDCLYAFLHSCCGDLRRRLAIALAVHQDVDTLLGQ
jgi:hypothetical protein